MRATRSPSATNSAATSCSTSGTSPFCLAPRVELLAKAGDRAGEHLLVVLVGVQTRGGVERDHDEVAGRREQARRGLGIGADVVLDRAAAHRGA